MEDTALEDTEDLRRPELKYRPSVRRSIRNWRLPERNKDPSLIALKARLENKDINITTLFHGRTAGSDRCEWKRL